MWRKGNPVYCWRECKLAQPLWKTLWSFLKKLKVELPYASTMPLWYYPKKTKTLTEKNIQPYVHCSIIFNNQDVEMT